MKQTLLDNLTRFGQQHLLAFWHELSEPERSALAGQISEIDFAALDRVFHEVRVETAWGELAARAESPPAIRLRDRRVAARRDAARRLGAEALAAGRAGAILVAGGEGSRLGFPYPKGMLPTGPVSSATLFQILFEKLLARGRAAGRPIPLYLMSSPATHRQTVDFLREKNYFGLAAEDVLVFCQGTMPALDRQTGRALLAGKGTICTSPDGHGGMLMALEKSGGLADIRSRGLELLFYFQVDNPLAPVCEPEFLGYHLQAASELSTLVVAKREARERVGNVVSVDGRLQIIEYSDLNQLGDDVVERRDRQGEPVFWAGNTAIHVINAAFLDRVAHQADALPFHRAEKAVPYVDGQGRLIEPATPNAVKLERFIFDLLPLAENGLVVEADRAETFAPVKNGSAAASDTLATAQQGMMALHRRWLRAAGVAASDDVPVEISPLLAQDEEEVARRIAPGTAISKAAYFC